MTGDKVYEAHSGKRLIPPAGQKYHPALARFAFDGRFVLDSDLVDTGVGKAIPSQYDAGSISGWGAARVTPSNVFNDEAYQVKIHLLPTAFLQHIPPDLLQLWAQVAVRGELGAEGEFVPWDEATWEKKRQELAAVKPPHPDFPFPGYVATDKLHWLRAEFRDAKTDADQLRLATELLRRSEASGDKAEAVRWRNEVRKRTRETLPPPRRE